MIEANKKPFAVRNLNSSYQALSSLNNGSSQNKNPYDQLRTSSPKNKKLQSQIDRSTSKKTVVPSIKKHNYQQKENCSVLKQGIKSTKI